MNVRNVFRLAVCIVPLGACNTPIDFGSENAPPKADSEVAGCAKDSDCGLASLHCDTLSHTCVACLTDSDCSQEFPRCDFALHRCVQCGSAADCPSGQTCERTGHCVGTCLAGQPCPAENPICDDRGICVRCRANADCAAPTAFCNVSTGQCVACLQGGQCPMSKPRCDPYRNVCVGCLSSADCSFGTEHHVCNPATGACFDE